MATEDDAFMEVKGAGGLSLDHEAVVGDRDDDIMEEEDAEEVVFPDTVAEAGLPASGREAGVAPKEAADVGDKGDEIMAEEEAEEVVLADTEAEAGYSDEEIMTEEEAEELRWEAGRDSEAEAAGPLPRGRPPADVFVLQGVDSWKRLHFSGARACPKARWRGRLESLGGEPWWRGLGRGRRPRAAPVRWESLGENGGSSEADCSSGSPRSPTTSVSSEPANLPSQMRVPVS
jgi:hypothetical protein